MYFHVSHEQFNRRNVLLMKHYSLVLSYLNGFDSYDKIDGDEYQLQFYIHLHLFSRVIHI